MELYVYLNGAKRGPFREEQVRAYLAEGLLQPADLALDQLDGQWKPLSSLDGRSPDAPAKVPPPVDLAADPAPIVTAEPLPQIAGHADPPPLPAESLGPYSRSTLAPNETPYFKTSLHWIVFARFGFLAFLLFLFGAIPFAIAIQAVTGSELGWFALPLPAFLLVAPAVAFASSELVITDRRVLIKTGVIRRQSAEMFLSKVESIAVDQGFLGRIFDFGTVRIRGTGGFEEAFESIAQPLPFRSWVQRLQGAGIEPRPYPSAGA